MPIEEIQAILSKFGDEESRIEKLMNESGFEDDIDVSKSITETKTLVSAAEAQKRNKQFLKEVEVVKGNLRSKAIFSPSEMQWEDICKNYREQPALPVTTFKCHLPIFV